MNKILITQCQLGQYFEACVREEKQKKKDTKKANREKFAQDLYSLKGTTLDSGFKKEESVWKDYKEDNAQMIQMCLD